MAEELEWPESVDPHMLEWSATVPALYTRFKADAGNLSMRRRLSNPDPVQFIGVGELNTSNGETLKAFLNRAKGSVFSMRCPVSGVRARFVISGDCAYAGSIGGETVDMTVYIARIYEGEDQ